jgi:hypothetical protein
LPYLSLFCLSSRPPFSPSISIDPYTTDITHPKITSALSSLKS